MEACPDTLEASSTACKKEERVIKNSLSDWTKVLWLWTSASLVLGLDTKKWVNAVVAKTLQGLVWKLQTLAQLFISLRVSVTGWGVGA
jgi:hypothetical protein